MALKHDNQGERRECLERSERAHDAGSKRQAKTGTGHGRGCDRHARVFF
jgi:hypothetical protein